MPIIQQVNTFGGGEWSPMLEDRSDLEKHAASCRLLQNFIPTPEGSLLKRPGLQRIGTVKQQDTDESTTYGTLVEFQITTHRSMVLALGGKRAKFIDRGAMLKNAGGLDTDFRITIPWEDVDLRLLRWKQINAVMYFVHPLYHPRVLTYFGARNWTLEEVDFEGNVPFLDENQSKGKRITSTFKADVDATVWSSASVVYERGDRVTNSGKVWVCKNDHTSSAPTAPNLGTTYFQASSETDRPLWVESYSDSASETGQKVTLTSNSPIFKTGHVGGHFEIAPRRKNNKFEVFLIASTTNNTFSNILVVQGPWSLTTFGTWTGTFLLQVSTDGGDTWKDLQEFSSTTTRLRNSEASGDEEARVLMRLNYKTATPSGTVQSTAPYCALSVTDGRIRGVVKITQFISSKEVKGISVTPIEKASTNKWSEGAWSDHQGFPRCVEFHQNRLVMAGTERSQHTVWGSALDDYANFKRGTNADEAYVHTLQVGVRDPILWMQSDRVLLVGNGGAEFSLAGETAEGPITPEFGVSTRHSDYGTHSGGASAIKANTITIFVQNGGRNLRELGYSFQNDKYEGGNLNLLAQHLFKNAIQDVAMQRQPFQILWVMAGGQLFSLTYERSQNVVAWARHPVGGEVIAIGSIRRYAEDTILFMIRRGDQLAIERFAPDGMLDTKDNGAWSDSYDTLKPDAGRYDITGHPLRGKRVVGWHAGQQIGPAVLDAAFFNGLTKPVVVGLPYSAVVWPQTPEVGLANGTSNTRECRIHKIVPSVYRSRGGKIGMTPTGPTDPLEFGAIGQLETGSKEASFDGDFRPDGSYCILSDEPFPFTLRSVTLKLNYYGDER